MFDVIHLPGRRARRFFASAAVLLLVAQSAIVGTNAWCMDDADPPNGEVTVQMAHDGGHDMPTGASDEEHSHHGADGETACPMMALCTLSPPTPFGGFTQTALVVTEAPATADWSPDGAVLSHTPPPPRV